VLKTRFLTCIPALLLGLTFAGPAAAQDGTDNYPLVRVETSVGGFTLELDANRAPLTVMNFLDYVQSGFYSGTVFHRVVSDFVIQGGGYDSAYKSKKTNPSIPNESGNGLSNRRGTVAMARTGDPHSADSQFYINLSDGNVALDPKPSRWGYTVFGKVIEGMDVVDQIGYVATGPGPVPELTQDVPREAIIIKSVTLVDRNPPPNPATEIPE
jgi:cyclophilin family peptidyl-prolyl cis-trans isomerase